MAEFLGDIAFMVEVLTLGVGVVIWHYGKKEGSKLVWGVGGLVGIVSILGMLCTGYFYMKYYFDGAFDTAYPKSGMMAGGGCPMMKGKGMKGMMGKGMMSGGGMGQGMMMQKMQNCMGKMEGKMMDEGAMATMNKCVKGGVRRKDEEMSQEEHESHH